MSKISFVAKIITFDYKDKTFAYFLLHEQHKKEITYSFMKTTTGERIKLVRSRLRLSQRELAQKMGITTSLVAQMEVNNRALTLENARKIAGIANTSPEWLLGESEFDPSEFETPMDSVSVCYLVEPATLKEGGLSNPTPEQVIEVFRIPKLKPTEKPYLAIQVQGEGISPVQEGDIAVIERITTQSEFVDGRIYVVSVTGTEVTVVKRVSIGIESENLGKLVLTGENSNRPAVVRLEDVKVYKIRALVKHFP